MGETWESWSHSLEGESHIIFVLKWIPFTSEEFVIFFRGSHVRKSSF
jgi:hypothetical protein